VGAVRWEEQRIAPRRQMSRSSRAAGRRHAERMEGGFGGAGRFRGCEREQAGLRLPGLLEKVGPADHAARSGGLAVGVILRDR